MRSCASASVSTQRGFWCWGLLNRHVVRVVAAHPALIAADAEPGFLGQHLTRSWIPIVIAIGAFAGAMVSPLVGMAVLVFGSPAVTLLFQRRAARVTPG